jgi:hypothetical protein
MEFLWCRPLRRLPRRRATNRNGSSGNELPSLSLYHVWRHGTICRGGVGRRQRDDWCFMRVNAYSDWVTTWQNGGGKGRMKWGKLSVCSNSRQWREIRVVRYKWWVACRRTKPGWVTVQNRHIYLSRINSASIFFSPVRPTLLPSNPSPHGCLWHRSYIDVVLHRSSVPNLSRD